MILTFNSPNLPSSIELVYHDLPDHTFQTKCAVSKIDTSDILRHPAEEISSVVGSMRGPLKCKLQIPSLLFKL